MLLREHVFSSAYRFSIILAHLQIFPTAFSYKTIRFFFFSLERSESKTPTNLKLLRKKPAFYQAEKKTLNRKVTFLSVEV